MKSKLKKDRRQFLKNASLAAFALGISPQTSHREDLDKLEKNPSIECDKTTLDFYGEGPFYTDNPPIIENSQLADVSEPGERMIISGRVFNLDCSEFIPDAIIDIWHADTSGAYDNVGYKLRGKTTSNSQGFYMFETIKPGKYLNGSDFRPSHIHFKITPPGFNVLTTQLYFEGDPDLGDDAASSITSGTFDASHRIISLSKNNDGKLEGTWDIVVEGEGLTGLNDIHIDKGILYKANPNPFSDRLIIKYGVFRRSKVSLFVYDRMGRQVAKLEENTLLAEKYEAIWEPDHRLPNGHYFIALKINDLQVHYLKVVRQR
jgi:protocatechuate 3,4-dioxygenase beta subunit